MNKWIFMLLTMASFAANAGNEVNNGGDVIQCTSSENLLTLDYVMTKNKWGTKWKAASVASLEESLERIGTQIDRKLPRLSSSFHHFVADLFNSTDMKRNHVWKPNRFDMIEVYDEKIDRLPSWCRLSAFGSVRYRQAVVRTEIPRTGKNPQIEFHYDHETLQFMSGLQRSFLVIHEWLWSISKDVVVNRDVNYYLHSKLIGTHSPREAKAQLKKISNGKL